MPYCHRGVEKYSSQGVLLTTASQLLLPQVSFSANLLKKEQCNCMGFLFFLKGGSYHGRVGRIFHMCIIITLDIATQLLLPEVSGSSLMSIKCNGIR